MNLQLAPVRHHCPACEWVGLSSLPELTHGSKSYWTCDHCGAAFEIRAYFTLLEPERMALVQRVRTAKDVAAPDLIDFNGVEDSMQKLVEILGEILYLRDRLSGLEEEAHRLREELGPYS